MIHTIRRTYLVRRVETCEVVIPDDVDPQHLIEEHFEELDASITGGDALEGVRCMSVVVTKEFLGDTRDDELDLELVEHEAEVIQIRRRDA